MVVPEVDRRAPVIVGVGQTNQRVSPDRAKAPIDLLADAARAADADTDARVSLLARADVVAVVAIGSWRYPAVSSICEARVAHSRPDE